jgi:hypothetical protein
VLPQNRNDFPALAIRCRVDQARDGFGTTGHGRRQVIHRPCRGQRQQIIGERACEGRALSLSTVPSHLHLVTMRRMPPNKRRDYSDIRRLSNMVILHWRLWQGTANVSPINGRTSRPAKVRIKINHKPRLIKKGDFLNKLLGPAVGADFYGRDRLGGAESGSDRGCLLHPNP